MTNIRSLESAMLRVVTNQDMVIDAPKTHHRASKVIRARIAAR